jgi:hypothetical protein
MKKFLKIYNTITEQVEVEPVEADLPAEGLPAEELPAEEPQIETLSPESEVLLVRLLKKALVTEIDPEDVDTVSALNDINEVNAKDTLTMLINVMKKYSTDIDIET